MPKTKQILLVVNPVSANRDKTEIIETLKGSAKQLHREIVVFQTNGKTDKADLKAMFNNSKWERVIVLGGDGTIKMVAETLKDRNLPIGIIPGGSANGLAINFDLSQDPMDSIETALGNNFIRLDSIEIDNELCLHMSDLGLNAELIQNYEASSVRGKLGYLLQSVPTLIKSNYPYKFQIEAEGKITEKEGVLLAFAVAQKYGTGANVNPHGKFDDGYFEILIFKSLDIIEIIKTLRNENDLDPDFIESISVKKAKVYCEKAIPFQIDGEFRGERKEISAKISKKQFRIAVPAEFKRKYNEL